MEVISTTLGVQDYMAGRAERGRADCVLVPTMGALHAGHGSLIRRGAELAEQRGLAGGCAVTIFVNPTQFNDPSDYSRYPRTLEADLDLCRREGASVVLAPGKDDVYPPGREPPPVSLPPQATEPGLEDAARPGHFAGVCQVVARLFEMVRPRIAVFGEKDWQQLQVVREMVRRAGLGIEIVGAPTVRESGGLAMSSRNVFLSPVERENALFIHRALREAGEAGGAAEAEARIREVLARGGILPDYAVVRHAVSLRPVADDEPGQRRALVAAKVGSVRLLDNAPWPGPRAG